MRLEHDVSDVGPEPIGVIDSSGNLRETQNRGLDHCDM